MFCWYESKRQRQGTRVFFSLSIHYRFSCRLYLDIFFAFRHFSYVKYLQLSDNRLRKTSFFLLLRSLILIDQSIHLNNHLIKHAMFWHFTSNKTYFEYSIYYIWDFTDFFMTLKMKSEVLINLTKDKPRKIIKVRISSEKMSKVKRFANPGLIPFIEIQFF